MPQLLIARPDLPPDRHSELKRYLGEMWDRALRGRQDQVDSDYTRWSKLYSGVPVEKERSVPFYKASNFVVKLIRIYLDTFVARTLNILFATKPLYIATGLPRELKESWEYYINQKALHEWKHYKLMRTMLERGARNGSVVMKTVHETKTAWEMEATDEQTAQATESTYYDGPFTSAIPFEDFYVYPSSAENGCTDSIPWNDVVIKFHRVRYPEEVAREKYDKGKWVLANGEDNFTSYLMKPTGIKQTMQESEAGVVDSQYQEFVTVECHLRYAVTNDSTRMYEIVAILHEQTKELIDVYFNPYPKAVSIFSDYRPYAREGLWYGESLCEILGQCQEEASVIHNDRRNNSFIANAVCFKRKNGSLLPNPSTNWYPGKVWDLQSMDDLDVISIGRSYEDMIPQEDYVFNLASQLSGIGESMKGTSQGQQGTRGMYNTMGTLSVMAEGNQRQDTNIRDVRDSVGALIATCSKLQAKFGSGDPFVDTMDPEVADQVRQAFKLLQAPNSASIRHEVQSSSAGANSEVRKASLLQMSQVLGQYGATMQQMVPTLLDSKLNPGLRMVMNDIIQMQSFMAKSLLREFNMSDMIDILPNASAAIDSVVPGGSTGTKGPSGQGPQGRMDTGGAGSPLPSVSREQLEASATLPQQMGGLPQ